MEYDTRDGNTHTSKILKKCEKVKKIWSYSYENFCLVRLELNSDADVDETINAVQKKINAQLFTLPDGIEPPSVRKFDVDDLPIIKLGIKANLNDTRLSERIKQDLIPEFTRLNGVSQVAVVGNNDREIQVNLQLEELKAYRVSIAQVLEAVGRGNVEIPSGSISNPEQQIAVRFDGRFKSLADIQQLVVSTLPDGTEIKLADVADVVDPETKEVCENFKHFIC